MQQPPAAPAAASEANPVQDALENLQNKLKESIVDVEFPAGAELHVRVLLLPQHHNVVHNNP